MKRGAPELDSQFIEFDEEFDVEDVASNLTEDDLMRIFGA